MAIHANPVNWFEIPASDLSRAKTFYETAFGYELTESEMGPNKMAWFPMEMDLFGAAGTLVQGEGYIPSKSGTVVYLQVADIESTLAKIVAAGGVTLMPKMSIGEHGHIAHFEDCEGNRVALHEKNAE